MAPHTRLRLMFQMPPQGLHRPEVMSLLAEVYRACPDSYEQGGFPDVDLRPSRGFQSNPRPVVGLRQTRQAGESSPFQQFTWCPAAGCL